jgi:hypothetical protein
LLLLVAPVFAQQTSDSVSDTGQDSDYGGPAILSRGATASLRAPADNVRIRPFVNFMASYDTGLTPVSVDENGQIPNIGSYGAEAQVGVLGFQRWKNSILGIDYRGDYRHYTQNTYFNGSDQRLSLIFKKMQSKRLEFTLRESAGIFQRGFYDFQGADLIDPNFANAPTAEIFDGRTYFLNTMGDMTYRKSARLSFNAGADGFVTRRRSNALFGLTGYRARGDMAYRTSRFSTSGIAYDFSHFEFTQSFGASDIHSVSFNQSFRLGRSWELSLRAGAARVETLGLTRVAVDPVIAAITGQSIGVEAFYRINWIPAAEAMLTRSFRHSSLTISYARGITPGNGIYLTSRQESVNGNFSYTGIRKWNLGISGGYVTFNSLMQNLGRFESYTGGAGATYTLGAGMHVIARYDYRHFDVQQSILRRDSYRASIGFGFSPGDLPLALW